MQAVAGHICYALAGLRDRDSKACKLVLVSRLNKLEDCVQAVAGHICYALAGLREREREITMPVYCAWCHISMNVRLVGMQEVAGHIRYILAGLRETER